LRRVAGPAAAFGSDRVLDDVERAPAGRCRDRTAVLVAVNVGRQLVHQAVHERHLTVVGGGAHWVDEVAAELRRSLVRFQGGQHGVHRRVAAVAFLVHRLTDARQQVAPDVAFAVEAGDVLVELALLVAIPRVLGGEAFQDEDVAELPAEVVALVLGGRLVVPVRRVALGRVDRFGHADDLVDLGPVARRRRDAPRRFDGDGGAGVAGDAAGLLGRRTG